MKDDKCSALRALVERLDWQTAERNDVKVASKVAIQREADTVHRLDLGGLLDVFMVFLGQIGFIDYLAEDINTPYSCLMGHLEPQTA